MNTYLNQFQMSRGVNSADNLNIKQIGMDEPYKWRIRILQVVNSAHVVGIKIKRLRILTFVNGHVQNVLATMTAI